MSRVVSRVATTRAASAAAAPVTAEAEVYGSKMAEVAARLKRREERMRVKREKQLLGAHGELPTFLETVTAAGKSDLMSRVATNTVQVNIGLLCNQACLHCHVESSPLRVTENMNETAIDRILDLIKGCPTVTTLDITGGAPEMNPYFRKLAKGARDLGLRVIDRYGSFVNCSLKSLNFSITYCPTS